MKDSPAKEAEISQLISDFKTEKIEEYLNKNSLNQALIKTTVEIDSRYRIAFDEKAWSGTFYDKTNNWFTNRKDPTGAKIKYKDDDNDEIENGYEHILDKFLRDYKTVFEADGKKFKGILLFITNINKQESDKEGGVSRTQPVNFREAIVFGSNLKDKFTYAHEIAHALGLEHTFWSDKDDPTEIAKNEENLNNLNDRLKINKIAVKEIQRVQKINENAIKSNKENIIIRQKEIDKLTIEKNRPTYPYKKDAQDRINQLEKENASARKINSDIQKRIDNSKLEQEKGNRYVRRDEDNLKVHEYNKFKFIKGKTLNIMDYSSVGKCFTKRQWLIMQNDITSYYGSVIKNK